MTTRRIHPSTKSAIFSSAVFAPVGRHRSRSRCSPVSSRSPLVRRDKTYPRYCTIYSYTPRSVGSFCYYRPVPLPCFRSNRNAPVVNVRALSVGRIYCYRDRRPGFWKSDARASVRLRFSRTVDDVGTLTSWHVTWSTKTGPVRCTKSLATTNRRAEWFTGCFLENRFSYVSPIYQRKFFLCINYAPIREVRCSRAKITLRSSNRHIVSS